MSSLKQRIRVPAAVEDVWRALTDEAALRVWLAEHVAVDLPGRYEFWGRYTPEGEEPRQRVLHAADGAVRFVWRLAGTDTVVELTLARESAATTALTLTQTDLPPFEEMVAETSTLGRLHTFWALALANLVEYVEGRALTPKCDFTSTEMRAEVDIAAAPAAVWSSLTDPGEFSSWFGARIAVEPWVGGRWAMGGFDLDPAPARIVELEPGERMALAWHGGLVTSWEVAGSAGHSRLTIVQSGFDDAKPPYGAWMGWLGGLAELRRYHEIPGWRSSWLEVQNGAPEGLLTLERPA